MVLKLRQRSGSRGDGPGDAAHGADTPSDKEDVRTTAATRPSPSASLEEVSPQVSSETASGRAEPGPGEAVAPPRQAPSQAREPHGASKTAANREPPPAPARDTSKAEAPEARRASSPPASRPERPAKPAPTEDARKAAEPKEEGGDTGSGFRFSTDDPISRRAIHDALNELVEVTKNSMGQPSTSEVAPIIERLVTHSGVPVTGEGGILERPPEQREIMCLFKNGIMLVSRSHLSDPYVLKLQSYARLRGVPVDRPIPVSLETIREAYRRGGTDDRKPITTTQMQRDIARLIAQAAGESASDIHIIVDSQRCIVEMRLNGVLRQKLEWRSEYGTDFCAACFAMADASDANYNPTEYQAARISRETCELPENVQALRLQFNPMAFGGRYLVIRLLFRGDSSGRQQGRPDKLGYGPGQIKLLDKMCATPFGIGIISGPTGSGKSTTLFNLLAKTMEQCNFERNVITIEDPPERPIFGAKQMPVTNAPSPEERARKFIQAISAAMRSDPDTIMIGEIRDKESAKLAVEAAMTGHQVWTTVHANDALMIVNRLRDIGVEEYNLFTPGMIFGLMGQRLARKLCDSCKIPVEEAHAKGLVPDGLWERLNQAVNLDDHEIFWPGDGCPTCGVNKGYGGRTVVAEVLYPDIELMARLRENDRLGARRYWIEEMGGISMLVHALDRMKSGAISPMEIERVVGPIELTPEETAHIARFGADTG